MGAAFLLNIQLRAPSYSAYDKMNKTAPGVFYEPSCITTSIVCCHARFSVPNPDRHFSYWLILPS
jgi:hypothetical protein